MSSQQDRRWSTDHLPNTPIVNQQKGAISIMIVVIGEIWKNISYILGKYKLLKIVMVAKQKCFSGSRKARKRFKIGRKIIVQWQDLAGSFPCLKFLYYHCHSLRMFLNIKVAVFFSTWNLDSKYRIIMMGDH